MPTPPPPGALVVLGRDACVSYLEEAPYSRIGFVLDGQPIVLSINHLLHGGAVYLRAAPGSKLGTAAAGQVVVIEADGGDAEQRVAWSVLVRGRASIVSDEAELAALDAEGFVPWALPAEQSYWMRVDVHDIDGRRIVRA